MSAQLQGVLVGAAVTLLAGLLVYFREKAKQQSEEARWIGKGVIALIDVCDEISKRVREWQRGLAERRGGVFEWVTDKEWNQFFEGYKVATLCLRHLLSPKFPGGMPQGIDRDHLQPRTQLTT